MTIILFDIDNFKLLNDSFGHLVGDEILQGVARVVKSNLRESDVLCRYGGEEFVILLENTDLNGGMIVAEKIRLAIERTPELMDKAVTASFGVAEVLLSESNHSALNRADKAMYSSKSSGRNRVSAAV